MAKCTDPNCKCYEKETKVEPTLFGGGANRKGILIDQKNDSILEAFGTNSDEMYKLSSSFGRFVIDGDMSILSDDFSWSESFGKWLNSDEFKKLEFGKSLNEPNYWFVLSQVFSVVRKKTDQAIEEFVDAKIDKLGEKLGPLGELLKHMGPHKHEDGSHHKSMVKVKAMHNGKEVPIEDMLDEVEDMFKGLRQDLKEKKENAN